MDWAPLHFSMMENIFLTFILKKIYLLNMETKQSILEAGYYFSVVLLLYVTLLKNSTQWISTKIGGRVAIWKLPS